MAIADGARDLAEVIRVGERSIDVAVVEPGGDPILIAERRRAARS
jgi:hypothetical protein